MAKKLTIVVTHYHEPWEKCKFLFDSIEIQKGIDFDDFDVLLVNDGEDVILSNALLEKYSYEINYIVKPHGGLSDTRNFGIDTADGEYIMFCDCDDGFLNNYGLHLVLGAINEGFDFLYSSFVEEQPLNGGWKIYRRDKDIVFVHGKCYRKQFLIDKNIRFDTEMYFSEDSIFNKIAYHEADVRREITTPFYLWAWNEDSTVRKDRDNLVLKEYDQIIKMRTKICEQLEERGFIDEFFDSVCKCVMDSYYDFNEPLFQKAGNELLVKNAEKAFKRFWKRYGKSFYECDSGRVAKVMMESRLTAYNSGLQMETIDLKSWLKHIKNDVKI